MTASTKPSKGKASKSVEAVVKKTETPSQEQPKRQQTSKTAGININPARVRCHLDKLNLNKAINTQLKPIKKDLTALKTAQAVLQTKTVAVGKPSLADAVQETRPATAEELTAAGETVNRLQGNAEELKSQLDALSKERTRFSNEASITLAIICDEAVQQFGEHAMKRVLDDKRRIIKIEHMHGAGVDKLPLYPLFKDLPSFKKTAEELANADLRQQIATSNQAARIEHEVDLKKKYTLVKKKVAEKAAEVAAVAAVAESPSAEEPESESAPADPENESKTSFKHYVGLVCKDVAEKNTAYENTRISDGIKNYLSNLLCEFIHRVSPLINLTTLCMKNKTVNDQAVLRTIESILIQGHDPVETVEFKTEQVTDPALLKEELLKRDAETAAGRKYTLPANMPTVPHLVATRKLQYPSSGFKELETVVLEKLELTKNTTQS